MIRLTPAMEKRWLFAAITTLLLISAQRGAAWIELGRKLDLARHSGTEPKTARTLISGWEGRLSDRAREAGVRHLLSVSASKTSRGPVVHVEWESGVVEAYRFLATLRESNSVGPCQQWKATGQRYRAVFSYPDGAERTLAAKAITVPPSLPRLVFVSAPTSRATQPRRDNDRQKQDEAALRKRQEEEQQRQEELMLASKRQELERSLVVTGIAHDGREALAFVTRRSGSGSLILRRGDAIEQARVVSIDEKRGEIALDYLGRISVTLKLNSAGATF